MVKDEIRQCTHLIKSFKRITILVANEEDIKKGFFEQRQLKLFGSIPIQLFNENTPISVSGMPPTGAIAINHDKFRLLPEWKQRFALRTMCFRLASERPVSKNLANLLKKYPIEYLRDMISYQRSYVSDIYMLRNYPLDWLREPKRIPETVEDPSIFYNKIKNQRGARAAIETALSNSVKILYLIFVYEYIDTNIKSGLNIKEEIERYRKYLESWWSCVKKDAEELPTIAWLIQKEDFVDESKLFAKMEGFLSSLDKLFTKPEIRGDIWEIQKTDLVRAVTDAEKLFGKSWLERQIEIHYSQPKHVYKFSHHLKSEPHPILWLYKKSIENLKSVEQNPDAGYQREALELVSFSDMVNELAKINVVGIDGKIVSMKSYDRFRDRLKLAGEFRQALYEIQIATALRKSGFKIFFILEDPKGRQTPDFMIKDEIPIFVECKYRVMTDKERIYDNAFKEFYYRIMRVMFRSGKFYLVCVEWLRNPTLGLIETVVARIEKAEYKDQVLETDNARIWLRKTGLINQVFDGPFNLDIGQYRSNDLHTDIIMQHAEVGIFNGTVKYKNPAFVMFRNISAFDNIVQSVVHLVDKAYSQIPKQGPSIIFIETHLPFGKQTIRAPLELLKSKLVGKLNIIGRVNRIVMTDTRFTQRNIKANERNAVVIAKTVESTILLNKKPTTEISNDTAEKIGQMKYL
jgi:hypothetical protein